MEYNQSCSSTLYVRLMHAVPLMQYIAFTFPPTNWLSKSSIYFDIQEKGEADFKARINFQCLSAREKLQNRDC